MTAVEWLMNQIKSNLTEGVWYSLYEQAKQMEKEQIINAFDMGSQDENRIGKEYYDDLYSL